MLVDFLCEVNGQLDEQVGLSNDADGVVFWWSDRVSRADFNVSPKSVMRG